MQVLQGLPKFADANALVGIETADDAAVYRINDKQAVVQTVDFFSPIVDDPYTFGQIAAANSISDIYAMGAKPLFALNIVGFPSKTLPLSVLNAILKGGADKAHEAGIAILGGHTVEDEEPKYGMVVTGMVDPAHITRNQGSRVGDKLVLTKPIGTGIVANAVKKCAASDEATKAAAESMARLNKAGAEAVAEVGAVTGCTDVTGFGLVGHLSGMLKASGVAANIQMAKLPLLPDTLELARQGMVPGGSKKNRSFYADRLKLEGADEVDALIVSDAQTSGGLLLSVPASSLDKLLSALEKRKTLAAVIGEVVSGPAGLVTVQR